jgi:hypothetical protein
MKSRPAVKRSRPRGYIENYNPQAKTLALLRDVGSVLQEYLNYWPLTVRQIFYRLIGAFEYPKTEAFYARLCEHVANARRGRMFDFAAIRDDGVSVIEDQHYENVDAFWADVRDRGEHYRRDKLANQDQYVEVWCEAAGMQPQLARVASRFSIGVYSSSGFDSLTAKYHLAQRICEAAKPATILHLGDFDPSGVSIFESLAEDVRAFVLNDRLYAGVDVEFVRVALTENQVEEHNLPTAPAKHSDSRAAGWGQRATCQLEALAPDTIADLLDDAIRDQIDFTTLQADFAAEKLERQQIAYALPAGSAA